jgi:hypothetical protein
VRAPAVDADGNDRAGIRVPDVAVPLGTYFGWNYRSNCIGASEHLSGEVGAYIPFQLTRAKRLASGDPRLSIEERYPDKAAYLEKVRAAAKTLVAIGSSSSRMNSSGCSTDRMRGIGRGNGSTRSTGGSRSSGLFS